MKPFIANADKAAPRIQNDLQLDLTVLTSLTEPFTTAGQRLFRYIVYAPFIFHLSMFCQSVLVVVQNFQPNRMEDYVLSPGLPWI